MDERTLTALKASIRHWEENVAAETPQQVDTGPTGCALCREFFENKMCEGCPVAARTLQPVCDGSPYQAAYDAYSRWICGMGEREQFQTAAQAELDFLRSLLPARSAADGEREGSK